MTTVTARIYQRLDIDPAHPSAENDALQRLTILNVHGKTCTRCKGTGLYPAITSYDASCYGCDGRGANGIALTQKALEQLDALEDRGALLTYRNRWQIGVIMRKARQALNELIADSGVDGGYVQYNAHLKPKGSWNRDLYDLHKAMMDAAQVINRFPTVREFEGLTPLEQNGIREQLVDDVEEARQRIEQLADELVIYRQRNPKPDFHALCLSLAGLESRGSHATA